LKILTVIKKILKKVSVDQKTEAEIVIRVLKGDRQAYALLVDEYKNPIYNLAYRMTNNLHDAEDLAQETFIRAYQNLSRYDQNRIFFTWLYTIGINLIRNHLKKNDRRSEPLTDAHIASASRAREKQTTEENIPAEEKMLQLEKSLQKLPVDLREAIVLKYYQGLTFEEVSVITGDSQSAVKMRVYRGLEKLKKMLEYVE